MCEYNGVFMKSAYIIAYLDIVEYSITDETKQVHRFKSLQREINHILYDEILHDNCILIPTGDGMIVGIKEIDSVTYIKSIELMIRIYEWAEREKTELRGSLHTGSVNVLKDINKRENLIGNTINNAARLLGGASRNSIIVSKDYRDNYLRNEDETIPYTFTICDEDTISDKHGFKYCVYSVIFSDRESGKGYGSDEKIVNKYKTNIYSTDYPKKENLEKSFIGKVKKSNDIKLVGIYHPNTPRILEELEIKTSGKVDISIYYASDSLKDKISEFFNSDEGNLSFTNKIKSVKAIKDWYNSQPHKDNIELNVYEYNEFLSFGASSLNIDNPGKGFIHISNYLQGVVPDKTPYIEMEWLTESKPPLYKFYADYLYKTLFHKELKIIDMCK